MDGGAGVDIVPVYLLRIDTVPFFVDNDRRPASESRTSVSMSDMSSAARMPNSSSD